jgi:threonine dehydrogenase-like Zn-dependent dehydrogenase
VRQLVYLGPGSVEWQEAPEPRISGELEAILEPIAVATCDLDVAMLRGTLNPFPGPFPLGHECVARVVDAGGAVRSVSPADIVVVPFQISCGACKSCAAGHTGNCTAVPQGSMYGLAPFGGEWGGFLADRIRVPYADAMLIRLEPGIDPLTVASASDNIPDAWRTVGPPLTEMPGGEVLIVAGGGSVPLYAVEIAVALGAEKVHYVDDVPERLALAEALGAIAVDGPAPRKLGPFPITVDASVSEAGLGCALRSTAPDGICTSIGIYLQDTPLPLDTMYMNGVTFRTGRTHARAAIPDVLDLVAAARLHPDRVTTAVVGWETAAQALADPPMKLVITRERPS